MPQITLEDSEWQLIVHVLMNASGPGISLAVVQPLVAKIVTQLPKGLPGKPNAIQLKEARRQ